MNKYNRNSIAFRFGKHLNNGVMKKKVKEVEIFLKKIYFDTTEFESANIIR